LELFSYPVASLYRTLIGIISIVFNPVTQQVTHVVVKPKQAPSQEMMVPVRRIREATPDLILLDCSKDDIDDLHPFVITDFMLADVPHYTSDPKMTALWPYVTPARRIISDTHATLTSQELAIRRGTRVRATDGRIGQVSEFLIDPTSLYVTHLVLREGLPWDRKYITIPVSEIDRIEKDILYLRLDKKAVRALPTIPISSD
jgi:sporulation protein YlmC with PRC-barrel domain